MIHTVGYIPRKEYGHIVSPEVFRILSPSTEVHWAGWNSSLHELYTNQWDVSILEDHMTRKYRVYLRHEKWDCVGIGEFDPIQMKKFINNDHRSESTPFSTHLNIGCKLSYNIHIQDYFEPGLTCAVDPRPQITDVAIHSLKDAKIFATINMKPEHEILVREPTMKEILQMALDNQEPEQERIRSEMIRNSKLKANLRMVI